MNYSHWKGKAPGFSLKVAQASVDVARAEQRLLETLRSEYPMGATVQVVHDRGSYFGEVVGWDVYGCRVIVKNRRTGKSMAWWAARVETVSDFDVGKTQK